LAWSDLEVPSLAVETDPFYRRHVRVVVDEPTVLTCRLEW
jgi:hypothetical protein